jgi:phosphotransferase system enzyme I (PtsI)
MSVYDVAAESVRHGTPVVPGVSVGPVVRPGPGPDVSSVAPTSTIGSDAEQQRYEDAVAAVSERLRARQDAAAGAAAEVLAAQVTLVNDRGLTKGVRKRIKTGATAEIAIIESIAEFGALLEKLGGLMAERVTDLRDLGQRVLATLLDVPEPGVPTPDVPSILLAEDLAPADTSGLDPAKILGLVTSLGGPTSHTAIIARQLAIPCIVAAPVDDIPVGEIVLINGASGDVILNPDPDHAASLMEQDRKDRAAAAAYEGPGRTSDGYTVQLLANVQDGQSAQKAAAGPSEGVGLFRSELAFLGRDTEPTVDEQAETYAQVFSAYGERKVVIRTLDAGSDKPMKFATLPDEPNPALGVRGLRLSWGNPGLLIRQLDAIKKAADETKTKPWVMAPMVATPGEARDFAAHVRDRGLTVGVMIEVPAAALLASQILEHVDFLSIGTNDLAQYTMAADRLAGDLARLTDYWQPAVVHLMALTAKAGQDAGKPVGVCGEAAADPLMACVLTGLGMSSLSMAASAVGAVGAKLATVTAAGCKAAAEAALAAPDPDSARWVAAEAL